MLDILVRGGLVVDGTGDPPCQADVAIAGGRVAAIGRLEGAEATTVIDARGQAVAPGFIDMHSHSDLSLPEHPRATSSLLQGITAEVAGSCGWSLAPLKNNAAADVLKDLCESLIGAVPREIVVDDVGAGAAWRSFGEYLDYLTDRGLGVNLYPIVGQSLIRAHVVGTERRKATPGEISAMETLLRACLEEGAKGLSTGRAYAPGAHASSEEIIALCRVVAARDGLYTSHVKDEGAGLADAVAEAIRIGRESGVRVEVSHHKAVGRENFGKVRETLTMLDQARHSGTDVTCDAYPYTFAQVFSLLGELPGLDRRRSAEEIRELFADETFREKVVAGIMADTTREGRAPGFLAHPDHYQFILLGRDHDLEGQTLDSVMDMPMTAPVEPLDATWVRRMIDRGLDFLLTQDLKVNIAPVMNEEDVALVLNHPETLVGTDAFCLDRDLGERTPIHPRHFGTFPRLLGYYRRDRGMDGLAGMIHRVTGLPARKLHLAERGLLARGMWADIVVFDPETIADRATGREPYLTPRGIDWVIVNGRVAVEQGQVSGVRAGMVLGR